jgi:hypothetical protein
MSRIPRKKEWPIGYMMPSTTIMELREAFTCKTMRQPSIQTRLLMKAIPPNVEPKRWGNNANMVTLVDLQ